MIFKGGLVDVGDGEFERVDVVVQGGRISAVGSDAAAGGAEGEVIDCGRLAIVPGMVNAHCHSNENWFRGRWDNLPLEPWMLFSYPALAGPVQSSRETYLRTLIGALDMVHSGATCVVDFLYEMAGFTDESLAAVVQAYRDLGLRALIVLGMG
ncbi:MAG TPA: amidohydrolase family protein, partial [Solirubrobacteraceae bacterium]|nr:amidohydrolase family protein [Solirubrobacteraceae bacterium]